MLELDPGEVRVSSVGEILNALEQVVAAPSIVDQEIFSRVAGGLRKLLELVVLEDMPADQAIERVTALYGVFDQAVESLLATDQFDSDPLVEEYNWELKDVPGVEPLSAADGQSTGRGGRRPTGYIHMDHGIG